MISDDELISMFEDDCRVRNLTKESTRRYVENVQIYKEYLSGNGGEGLLKLDKDILRGFVTYLRDTRGHKQKTIDNIFSSLNAFYDLLVYEEMLDTNIILPFRKRYLRRYKTEEYVRKIPEIDEMARFIDSINNPRDRAIVVLFCKTGIRRGELLSLDVDDLDWKELSFTLKPVPKRTNRRLYFDSEAASVLKRWIRMRENLSPRSNALFVNSSGDRLGRHGVYDAVVKWATRYGLHDPNGKPIEDAFSPHSLRHWWTTMMRRGGASREVIQVLRGDSIREAIDLYTHLDQEEIRTSYLKAVPQLGII